MLNKALSATPPALGFRPVAATRPHMALVASLEEISEETAGWVKGADAAILSAGIKAKDAKSLSKTLGITWGISLDDSPQAAKLAESSKADFIVFEPTSSLEIMAADMGRVMIVEGAMESALLHGAGELPIEAVYFKRQPQQAVTWLELMQLRRVADLIAKPLLVPVSPDIAANQLGELWKAGVDGVVVSAAPGVIAEMRSRIDGLALPDRRKWLKPRPLVPVISAPAESHRHEEDPDEDDEE
jgi:hypothetical protein